MLSTISDYVNKSKMSEKDVVITSFKFTESLISTLPTQQWGKERLMSVVNAKLNYRTSTNKYEGPGFEFHQELVFILRGYLKNFSQLI